MIARRIHLFYNEIAVNRKKTNRKEECTMTEKEAPRCQCGYCMGGELLDAFGIPVCELSVSQLILFREQSHPGRCIVAYKDHVSEIVDISPEERAAFMEDIARAAKAIHAVFHPDKLNYGAYGDTGCHLHVHLVPKYRDGYEWGGVFAMNPGQTKLSEEAYAEMIEKLKANL